jgi:hypothetical protein
MPLVLYNIDDEWKRRGNHVTPVLGLTLARQLASQAPRSHLEFATISNEKATN